MSTTTDSHTSSDEVEKVKGKEESLPDVTAENDTRDEDDSSNSDEEEEEKKFDLIEQQRKELSANNTTRFDLATKDGKRVTGITPRLAEDLRKLSKLTEKERQRLRLHYDLLQQGKIEYMGRKKGNQSKRNDQIQPYLYEDKMQGYKVDESLLKYHYLFPLMKSNDLKLLITAFKDTLDLNNYLKAFLNFPVYASGLYGLLFGEGNTVITVYEALRAYGCVIRYLRFTPVFKTKKEMTLTELIPYFENLYSSNSNGDTEFDIHYAAEFLNSNSEIFAPVLSLKKEGDAEMQKFTADFLNKIRDIDEEGGSDDEDRVFLMKSFFEKLNAIKERYIDVPFKYDFNMQETNLQRILTQENSEEINFHFTRFMRQVANIFIDINGINHLLKMEYEEVRKQEISDNFLESFCVEHQKIVIEALHFVETTILKMLRKGTVNQRGGGNNNNNSNSTGNQDYEDEQGSFLIPIEMRQGLLTISDTPKKLSPAFLNKLSTEKRMAEKARDIYNNGASILNRKKKDSAAHDFVGNIPFEMSIKEYESLSERPNNVVNGLLFNNGITKDDLSEFIVFVKALKETQDTEEAYQQERKRKEDNDEDLTLDHSPYNQEELLMIRKVGEAIEKMNYAESIWGEFKNGNIKKALESLPDPDPNVYTRKESANNTSE